MSTGNMALPGHQIAPGESFDIITHAINDTDEFVTNGNRHRHCFLRPSVPIIYVDVGPADGCFHDAYTHIVAGGFGDGNCFQPSAGLSPTLHDGCHCCLYDYTL